jgi:hypothetical protein
MVTSRRFMRVDLLLLGDAIRAVAVHPGDGAAVEAEVARAAAIRIAPADIAPAAVRA